MKKFLIGLIVLVILVVVVISLFLGQIIKAGVEKVGPEIAGVDISLESCKVNLLAGNVNLKGLVIGNPEGFETDSAMELGELTVAIDTKSILSNTIIIKEIHISEPAITYEQELTGNNLGALAKNFESEEDAEKPEEEKAESDESGKKVVIKDFLLEGGKLNVSLPAMGGKAVTIALETIHLENIGEDTGGASLTDIIQTLLGSIIKTAGNAIAGAGDLAAGAVEGVGNLAGSAVKGAGNVAGSAVEGAGNVAGSAVEGVGNVAGSAVEGAGSAVKGTIGAVGKLLGGGDKE